MQQQLPRVFVGYVVAMSGMSGMSAMIGGDEPSNGYVAENGTTYYVAENGTTYYVQES